MAEDQPTTPDELCAEWARYNAANSLDSVSTSPVTLQAWDRCRSYGVDPHSLTSVLLSPQELESRLQANVDLIKAATPYMNHLSRTLAGKPHLIMLADAEGWVIALAGDAEGFGGLDAGIALGAGRDERLVGNNGIGTALALGAPVLIYGCDHYVEAYRPATCIGVPIRCSNKIVGCLNVSVRNEDAHPARLTLTQACVECIETALASATLWNQKFAQIERFTAVGSLIATAAHDMREPLTGVRALAELGSLTCGTEQDRLLYCRIVREIDELSALVSGLLSTTTGEEAVVIQVPRVVEEVVRQFEPVCQREGIRVHYTVSGRATARLQLRAFGRALRNILVNAVEAMPCGGTLQVAVSATASPIRIEVKDTGVGIPVGIQESLFQPFVSGRPGGTGLGLYMAHKVVTANHQGKVWFETHPGEGTTFFIEVPAEDSGEARASIPSVEENVIQLRCSICDHWKGNGGGCAGRESCDSFLI